jgi:hypothetical protein
MPTLNGPVHTMCKIIDVVVGLAAEAKIGAGYLNGQDAVPIITTLTGLGHPQPRCRLTIPQPKVLPMAL